MYQSICPLSVNISNFQGFCHKQHTCRTELIYQLILFKHCQWRMEIYLNHDNILLSQCPDMVGRHKIVDSSLVTIMSRPQRRSIFQGDGMVNVFFRPPLPLNVFLGVQPLEPMVFRWFSKFWGQWSTMVYFTLCGLFLAPFGPFLTLFEPYLKKHHF